MTGSRRVWPRVMRPDACPHQVSPVVEGAVCELRRAGSARVRRDFLILLSPSGALD